MHYLLHASKRTERRLQNNPPHLHPKKHRQGTCDYCGLDVPVNQGILIGDAPPIPIQDPVTNKTKNKAKYWQLYHFKCLEAAHPAIADSIKNAAATQHIARIDLDKSKAAGVVTAERNDALFQVLLPILKANGGKNKPDSTVPGGWKNLIEFKDIPRFTKALTEEGTYAVSVSDEIASHTKSIASALDSQAARAKARTKQVEADIKKWNEDHKAEIDAGLLFKRLWMPHQPQGIEWLMTRPGNSPTSACGGALLADDPGLGKTMQAINALPEGAPCLVVCPVSVKYNWQDEFKMWRPERPEAIVIDNGETFRWPGRNETIIIGYPTLIEKPPIPKARGTVIIVDEAQDIKGKSARNRKFNKLSEAAYATDGCVWLLTGTPLENIADNVYRILEAGDLVGRSFGGRTGFINAFGVPLKDTPVGQVYDWRGAKPDTAKVTAGLDKVMLRRQQSLLREAGLLPEKFREVIPVELDRKALEALTALPVSEEAILAAADVMEEMELAESTSGKRTIDDDDIDFLIDAAKGDNSIGEISTARRILAMAKVPAAEAIVEQFEKKNEPILVFSCSKDAVNYFGRRKGWDKIDGSVKALDRRNIVKAFQAGKLKGLAIVIRAGGTGLTLHRANTALFIDMEWNPAKNIQAEDRIYRIGQKRNVMIYQMVGNHPIDKHLHQLLAWKQNQMDATVNAVSGKPVGPGAVPIIDAIMATPISTPIPFDDTGYAPGPSDPTDARRRYLERINQEQSDRKRSKKAPTREQLNRTDRRQAQTDEEAWIAGAVQNMTGMDEDYARWPNGHGWNQPDSNYGHQLAGLLSFHGGLTDDEWQDAREMLRKYHGQVGRFGVVGEVKTKKPRVTIVDKTPEKSKKESGRLPVDMTVAGPCPGFITKRGRPPKDPTARLCGNCGRMLREH